jgi:hypothetical protein
MKLILGILNVLFLLLSAQARAQVGQSCEVLEESWRSHYTRDLRISWDTRHFSCDHNEGVFAQALYDLEKVKLSADEHGYIPNFYKLVRKNLTGGIHNHLGKTETCKTAIAYARTPDNTITLCPAFYTDDRVDRASTLAHESRHLDPRDPRHVTCIGGSHVGISGACDQKFYDGRRLGSGYNADVNYLATLVNHEVGNELSRSKAQSYINYYLGDSFNEITGAQLRKWRRDASTVDVSGGILPEVVITSTRIQASSPAPSPQPTASPQPTPATEPSLEEQT